MSDRDRPLVTVLVTFHNQARFVGPTLDSVLAQSYPRLETVVVDDGSTDDTRERCARYGDRVRLITRPNGGSAAARNTGLAAARDVYIAHMDGDDLWHPDKIAVQVDAALRYPEAGMLVADGHVLREGEPDERGLGGWETRLRVISDAELSLRIASRYPIVFVRGDLVGYRYVASSISGPKELRSLTWGLEEFRMLRLHRRLAAPAHRRIMRRRARQNAVFQAREAYYRGRRGDRGWAVRYLLRLLRESRRPHLVAPFLASLVLPPGLVAAAVRLLGKRPAGRALAHSGA
jgi:glycosyltransferase involved in cell wall biosynthesis